MYKIGLTGGIGSGKSYVAGLLAQLGYPVFDSDSVAKKLMTQDTHLVADVQKHFGADTYLPDGSLNRARLAAQVFGSEHRLNLLNSLVHPRVRVAFHNWHQALAVQPDAPAFCVQESALVYEARFAHEFHQVWLVHAPMHLRVARAMARDNATAEQIKTRIDRQLPELEKILMADRVILNNGQTALLPQLLAAIRSVRAGEMN